MSDPIEIRANIAIPADAILMKAVRSGGPGGQNVNKVASKVELRVDIERITGMDPDARERLRTLSGRALDANGRLLVTSQKTRDQRMNLDDAREKIRELVLRALVKPRSRRATRPTRGSVERRIVEKKHRAKTKSSRRDFD